MILRGKTKPLYTPHVDCGDHVVVINAEKVRLTGKKWDDKVYLRHTTYPGGQRSMSPKEMMVKDPRRMIEFAVKGMLPKNSLGRQLFTNLHVYAGSEHPHQGQNPEPIELRY
jgi:large subunit ribosomal protein L13